MRYTDAQKRKLKKKIIRKLKDGSWSLGAFADSEAMDRKTLRRWILQDKKLNAKVKQFNEDRKEEEATASEAKRKEKKTGRSQKPFETTEVENDKDEDKGTSVITTRSLDVKTIEDALRIAEVDRDVWEVERSKVNSWEVTIGKRSTGTGQPETYTNFQVTVWLRRITGPILALRGLLDKIESKSPVCPKIRYPTESILASKKLKTIWIFL